MDLTDPTMNILQTSFLLGRAVDPHSFYYSFETNYRMKSFLELKKTKKVAQKLITIVASPNLF